MKSIEIKGTPRTDLGSKFATRLRNEGQVPCVVYGGQEPIHFYTDNKSFKVIAYTPDVYAVTINLGDRSVKAVMQDLQFHPVTDNILHADFIELVDGKAVQVDLPINLMGTARGVRNGGRLKQNMRKLTVKALPQDLPASIDINMEPLRIGQSIKVEDIKKAGNYEFMNSGGAVIVSIATSRKAVADVEEDADGEEATAPEGETAEA
jgi:large subunit ribosomal protein L25